MYGDMSGSLKPQACWGPTGGSARTRDGTLSQPILGIARGQILQSCPTNICAGQPHSSLNDTVNEGKVAEMQPAGIVASLHRPARSPQYEPLAVKMLIA